MKTSGLAVVAVVAAALAATSSAAARSSLKVCRLVSAKQVATIPGVSSRCAEAGALPGPGSTIYGANWAGKTARSARLQVTVSVFDDKSLLKLAAQNLDQGLVGAPKKLTGIGSAAYAANGAVAAEIHFAVGKDVVSVIVTTIGKPPRVTPALKALAAAIAANL